MNENDEQKSRQKVPSNAARNQGDESLTPPDGPAPVQAKPWLKFQLSLRALVFIHILIACVIGIWVQNQTFGMVAAGTLIACLLVVYVDEANLFAAVLVAIFIGGLAFLTFYVRPSGRALRTAPRLPPSQVRLPAALTDSEPRRQLNAIGLVVECFHQEHARYPDDSDEHRFFRELMNFDSHEADRAPLLQVFVTTKDTEDESFSNSMGKRYTYKVLRDKNGTERSFILIDPGEDGLLGGTIEPSTGFVPDGSAFRRDNLIYQSGR